MPERKYSVSEIDQMRGFIEALTLEYGVGYQREQLEAQVEDRLRTYMLNGTEPVELEQAALRKYEQRLNRKLGAE